MSKMRIGIDCRLSGNAHAGIGRYIENLITRLPLLSPDITWVFFFHDQKQVPQFDQSVDHTASNIEIRFAPVRHYSLAEQFTLLRYFNDAQLDLLHVPHFNVPLLYQGKLAITIHDLLWHEYKGSQVTTLHPVVYWLKYVAYRFVASRAINKAKLIYVPTETVKATLAKYYPAAKSKIVVTQEGVSGEFKTSSSQTKTTHRSSHKDLVYVGSLYPHKNITLVLQALTQLPDWHLHLVGSRNVFQQKVKAEVKKLGVAGQVTFQGYLSDQELTALLHASTALVQPSLSEGFGLTGVEAMAAGIPVVASDIPVFREVYQEGALFFDPRNVDSLVATLNHLNQETINTLVTRGRKVSAGYSWDAMAQKTLAGYRQLL
ncbi:MAG TPA: glycosyltransferase family 1 protein [Patescibacteria group bacterium]